MSPWLVASALLLALGVGDAHWGANLNLPDGTYSVTVTLGDEQAQFRGVMVSSVQMPTPK